jgi:hypothetical protein
MKRLALILLALTACGAEELDPEAEGLPTLDGYTTWQLAATVSGELPGHGDSARLIYVNPVGRNYSHSGPYQVGTVLVKEVRARNDDGTPGELRYLAIMRKVGEDAEVSVAVDGGWVFTIASSMLAREKTSASCWATCHRQATHDGAWLDYGQ